MIYAYINNRIILYIEYIAYIVYMYNMYTMIYMYVYCLPKEGHGLRMHRTPSTSLPSIILPLHI